MQSLKLVEWKGASEIIDKLVFKSSINMRIDGSFEDTKEIREGAFFECNIDGKIVFGKNLEVLERYAFQGTAIEEIDLSKSRLGILEENLFARCSRLTRVKLPETIQWIKTECFKNCTKLKEINIPKNSVKLGLQAFEGCTELKEMDFNKSNLAEYNIKSFDTATRVVLPSHAHYVV